MHLPMNKHAINFSTYYSDLTIGLEVVLPTGELLVTGSAALPGARPQSARAYGPNLAALFLSAQGTLGIVVKQNLPLWRIPEARHMVQGNFNVDNFKGLSNSMYKIMDDQFEGSVLAEMVWAIYDGTGKSLEWEFYVEIFGSKDFVDFYRKSSEKLIIEEGGKIITSPRILEPETDYSPQLYEEFIYWRPRANSICTAPFDIGRLDIGCVSTYDILPELYEAALKLLSKHGVPKNRIRNGILMTRSRSGAMLCNLSYLYNKSDVEEVKRAKAIQEEWEPILAQIIGEKRLDFLALGGSLPYRLTPAAAKTQLPRLGEYYKLLVKLKQMLDPNRIMNPGKFMDIEPY